MIVIPIGLAFEAQEAMDDCEGAIFADVIDDVVRLNDPEIMAQENFANIFNEGTYLSLWDTMVGSQRRVN